MKATIRNICAHPIYVHGRPDPIQPSATHDVAEADRNAIAEQLRRESFPGATKTIEVVHDFGADESDDILSEHEEETKGEQ